MSEPFDLDRACDEAMERLRLGIAISTIKAHEEWTKACYARACRAVITKEVEKFVRTLGIGQMFADCMGIGGIVRSAFMQNKTMEQK